MNEFLPMLPGSTGTPMTMLQVLALACVLLSLATPAYGYKSGAPLGACSSMFPHHDDKVSQTGPSPYTITVSSTTYKKNENISVTISTNEPTKLFFEGFFLQARRADCSDGRKPIGRFYLTSGDSEVKVINCTGKYPGNAATHTSSAHRVSKTFIWNNPDGMDVFFQATVVNHKHTFWSNLQSKVLVDSEMGNNGAKYDACPALTNKDGQNDDDDHRGASSCSAVQAGALLGIAAFFMAVSVY